MALGKLSLERSNEEHGDMAEINVIPLVDVLLVLLIVFMVAAPLSIGGIKIDLPFSKVKGHLVDEQRIILSINSKGEYFIENEQIPAVRLEEKMKNIYQFREKKEIFIRSDRTVPYGSVIDAMSASKLAGVSKISMLTQPHKR